jgi:hypothetical protein
VLEVEIGGYYDFSDVTISLNDNSNFLGEQGMAAKMHVFLLSRDYWTDISEKRCGASQFVRTVVFAVFHQLSFNVSQVKVNHRRLFPYKVENCYIPTTRLIVKNREPTCVWKNNVIRYVEWTSTRVVGTLSQ